VASLTIGLAGLAVSAWQLLRPPLPGVSVDESARLDQAAIALADAVSAQWEAEAGLQGFHRSAPLRLRWSTTTRPVAASAETVVGSTITGRVVRLRLHGHLDEVADRFLALPHRRLVVLGAPGAGKTVLAMLLTLALLGRRQPHEPVPVLLDLSRWDPAAEHLHAWLARRLGEDYPALRSPAFGPDAAQRLLAAGRILPLLDGLDELPKPVRAIAIAELDRARGDRPLVVTCRSQEYQQAVTESGALAAAAVVELERVTATEAIAFLRADAPTRERWDQVANALQSTPHGALAAALSTPLMVALARTVYASPARDPSELVALAQAGGRTAVEGHLLEGFIPAAFAALPPAPGSLAPPRRWDPQAARRWLTVLALHLNRQNTHDLAWWQLHRLLPAWAVRPLAGLLIGLPAGLVVGLAFWLVLGRPGGLPRLLVGALMLGLLSGLMVGLAFGSQTRVPTQIDTRIRAWLGGLALGLAVGLVVGLATGLAGGQLVFGLTIGLAAGLVGTLSHLLRQPVDITLAVTPRSVHRSDRTMTIVFGLVGGLAAGLAGALVSRLVLGPEGGRLLGPGTGLLAGLVFGPGSSAWGRFTVLRGWLALRGRLPWRLLGFLDDAHRLAVLRQAGAVYQFRHARLQDHLAATSKSPPTR
jgi:NACHT domain